jgi:uncharacterized protein YcbK (DUF882 family)
MNPTFMDLMDSIREDVGEPIGVVSGFRCTKHDEEIHGDGNHNKGKAIDVAAALSQIRFKIVSCAIKRGIKRIGIGKTFIHLDTVEEHPQDVIWLY